MTARDLRALAATLGAALAGAGLFHFVGFPVAALTGAALAVSCAALAGMPVALPAPLRTLAFLLLGINIGTGVTPEMLETARVWPVSIAFLAASLMLGMAVGRIGLERWLGFDRRSATLASAPGHLTYVLALSLEGDGRDTARLAIVQSIRVLFLTLCVPVFVVWLVGSAAAPLPDPGRLTPSAALALLAASYVLGLVFQRLAVPAGMVLAGMAVSALGHVMGWTQGRLPAGAGFGAFVVMGALIGSRFAGQRLSDLRASALAGVWVTAVSVLAAFLGVAASFLALGLPPALLFVAFAPGGVESMAAIALSLGLDPAFVAAHHVMRLLILTALIPLLLARLPRA